MQYRKCFLWVERLRGTRRFVESAQRRAPRFSRNGHCHRCREPDFTVRRLPPIAVGILRRYPDFPSLAEGFGCRSTNCPTHFPTRLTIEASASVPDKKRVCSYRDMCDTRCKPWANLYGLWHCKHVEREGNSTSDVIELFDTFTGRFVDGRLVDIPVEELVDQKPFQVHGGGIPIFKGCRVVGGIGVYGNAPEFAEYAALIGSLSGGPSFGPLACLPQPRAVFLEGVRLPFVQQATRP